MQRTETGPYASWRKPNARGPAFWTYLFGPPLVVAAVLIAALGVRTLDESHKWVVHTREVREYLSAATGALLDAEAAQQGYLLTREMAYAEQFTSARDRIAADLASIRRMTSDNPVQQRALRELDPQVEERLGLIERTLALEQAGDSAGALELMESGSGKGLTAIIRTRLDSMQGEEERLLRRRMAVDQHAGESVIVVIFGIGALALGVIALLRILTIREQRQRASRESRLAEQARLLDLSRDAIIVRDSCDRVRYWSQGAIDLYGYSREEAVGQVSHELLRTQADESLEQIRHSLERTGRWQGELRHCSRSGEWLTTLSTWTLSRDPKGNVDTILEANNDITAKKSAEETLHRSNRELAELTVELERRVVERTRELSEANTELEAFARSVAHDLRAPLRTMQGFSTALIEDYSAELPTEGQTYARRIASAAERMDRLILDLLDYARLSRVEIRMEPIPLDQVLGTVASELADDVRRSGAQLVVRVGSLTVQGNRTLLAQVFSNLISNGLKFAPSGAGARVEVFAERSRGRVRIWVTDNGIGIAPEHHERIFGVFERLHGSDTYPGTGIGLAIVRRAVERMGGKVGVLSEVGRGSRFWFDLAEARVERWSAVERQQTRALQSDSR